MQRLADRVPVIAEHGARASKASLAAHFGSADVIVLSTHGHFDPAQPGRSRLVFADGDWTLAEILDQQSLARGPVVVLSACEIGASAVTLDPRETSGIPGALLSAGVAAVLAAQWPVEDVWPGFSSNASSTICRSAAGGRLLRCCAPCTTFAGCPRTRRWRAAIACSTR